MKREKRIYQLTIPDDDYKMQHVMTEAKKNFESIEKWLYVGANINNKRYAKLGITEGNLQSRSYATQEPGYYIFCAFKCNYNISKQDLEIIEHEILSYLDNVFVDGNGTSKRMRHFESNKLSECFHDVSFDDFLHCVHSTLYAKYLRHFPYGSVPDIYGNEVGDAIDCEFNNKIPVETQMKYLRFISQY